jgi:hypothetical protein
MYSCTFPIFILASYMAAFSKLSPAQYRLRGRLHGAFLMCVFMSDKPFVAKACPPMSHASASNGLSDIETHTENAP